jgi:hypothetical protein
MNLKRILVLASALLAAAPAARAACPITTGDFDGNGTTDIRIEGDGGKQRFLIDVQAAQTVVSISCNGDADFTDPGDVDALAVPGSFDLYDVRPGGTDVIDVVFSQSLAGASKLIKIVLLGGTNVVNFTASPGVALQAQSRVVAEVHGYLAADTVRFQMPALDASAVLLRTDMSIGNDRVEVTLGDMANGALADVDAILAGGSNVFVLTQPEGTTIAGSTVEAIAEGFSGLDNVGVNLAGVAGSGARLRVAADLSDGTDLFTARLDLASFDVLAGGEVLLDARGGNGSDAITVTRDGSAGGAGAVLAGVLDLRLSGGLAADKLTVDLAGGGFAMNGGTLRLRAEGGASNDVATVALQADASSTNPIFDVHLHGGPQNDTLSLALDNGGPGAAANYGPAGQVIVDGSHGVDACAVTGNPLQKTRNCE